MPVLGSRPIHDLIRGDISKLHEHVRTHHGPTAAANMLRVVHALFSWLIETGELETNPAQGVKPTRPKPRERWLTAEELGRLGDALTAHETRVPLSVAALRLLLLSGCRRGEVLSLRWDEVDNDGGCLRLKTSKTGPKTVPLGAAAFEVIDKAKGWRIVGCPYIFPSPWTKTGERVLHLTSHDKAWGKIREAAGLDGLRIHDLRHAFASVAVASGETLYVTGKLLGHSAHGTTQRYAHIGTDPLRQAAERTSRRLADALAAGGGGVVVALPSRLLKKSRRAP